MSGKGDGSSDLSRRDFPAMMYYDYCQGKSCQECFQSLKHCFGDQFPSKATVQTGGSDSSCLERERWKTLTFVVE